MFDRKADKEMAEEYADSVDGYEIKTYSISDIEEAYLAGHKAGRALQWHYVENGDLPEKSILVLAYCQKDESLVECLYIPDVGFKHPIFSNWYEPTAWVEKEIVLPDEAGK